MKLVTFAVFVMRTTKIASFCFYCVESGNHRVRTARVSTTAGAWKTDENIIQIDKFPITTGFSWLSPATGINIFSYFFLKLPRQVDRQHSDPWNWDPSLAADLFLFLFFCFFFLVVETRYFAGNMRHPKTEYEATGMDWLEGEWVMGSCVCHLYSKYEISCGSVFFYNFYNSLVSLNKWNRVLGCSSRCSFFRRVATLGKLGYTNKPKWM